MPVALNPEMIFFDVRAAFSACEVHSQRVCLSTGSVFLVYRFSFACQRPPVSNLPESGFEQFETTNV